MEVEEGIIRLEREGFITMWQGKMCELTEERERVGNTNDIVYYTRYNTYYIDILTYWRKGEGREHKWYCVLYKI